MKKKEDLNTFLEEEFKDKFEIVAGMEIGTKEYNCAMQDLLAIRKAIDDSKNKKTERTFLRVEKIGRIAIEGGLGVATIATSVWFAKTGWKFEETGTYLSKTFMNGLSKFKIGQRK